MKLIQGLCLLMILNIANAYVFYYSTSNSYLSESKNQELTWRHCYYTLDLFEQTNLIHKLNITKIISQDDFERKWHNVSDTIQKVKDCSKISVIESSRYIPYLDTNCFNFVKTIQKCKDQPTCIWNEYHHVNEFQKILHAKNIFTCDTLYIRS